MKAYQAFAWYLAVSVVLSGILIASYQGRYHYAKLWALALPIILLFRFLAVVEIVNRSFPQERPLGFPRSSFNFSLQAMGFILGSVLLFIEVGEVCQTQQWWQSAPIASRWLTGMDLVILLTIPLIRRFAPIPLPRNIALHRWLLFGFCVGPLLCSYLALSAKPKIAQASPVIEMILQGVCCLAWTAWLRQKGEVSPVGSPMTALEGYESDYEFEELAG